MKHRNKVFSHRAIRLDGNQFEECVFEGCVLEIGGASPFKIERCQQVDCETMFVGAAGNVMVMLAQLYADPDSRGAVERLFEQLKGGGVKKSYSLVFLESTQFNA